MRGKESVVADAKMVSLGWKVLLDGLLEAWLDGGCVNELVAVEDSGEDVIPPFLNADDNSGETNDEVVLAVPGMTFLARGTVPVVGRGTIKGRLCWVMDFCLKEGDPLCRRRRR